MSAKKGILPGRQRGALTHSLPHGHPLGQLPLHHLADHRVTHTAHRGRDLPVRQTSQEQTNNPGITLLTLRRTQFRHGFHDSFHPRHESRRSNRLAATKTKPWKPGAR